MSAGVWVARSAGPSNAVAGRPDDARAALAEGLGATPAFPATFERWLADGILPERPSIAPGVVIKSPGRTRPVALLGAWWLWRTYKGSDEPPL